MKKAYFILVITIVVQFILFNNQSSAQEVQLKAGIAKVDITPTESLYMDGYDESCRMNPSEGHLGNIYIRSLVLDDGENRIVLLEADLVFLHPEDYTPLRELIAEETGVSVDNILLGCTHNHASPKPGGKNKNSEWSLSLNDNFILAVKNAISDLEPVKIGGGTGESTIAMNRRKRMEDTMSYISFDENNSSQSYGKYKTDNPVKIREMEGVYRLGANPSGSIDDEIGIMRIDKLSGEPKALIVNYACHGTSLGARNNTVDSEWNGHMLEYLEKEIPGVIGIFIQGAAGDINPRIVGGLDGYKDNIENTVKLGHEIGKEVVKVFNEITADNKNYLKIEVVHEDIICPLKYDRVVKNFKNTTVSIPTTAMRIGDFTWVTFPGELFHEIGQVIKLSTHARYPFIVGYCNGSLGYLPTQQAYSEGGYEPWTSRFAPPTEKIYLKEVEKMLIPLY